MELSQFIRIKSEVEKNASAAQILELQAVVRRVVSLQVAEVALERRTDAVVAKRTCVHCQSHNVVLHGKSENGRQRFKCRDCHRTYNTLTGTAMARARKPQLWGKYLACMTDFMSIRKIGQKNIDISHVTIFRWRHRFLKAAVKDNAALLSGVVEADETYFLRSFKGSRGWKNGEPPENRAARPRAWGATKRGLSNEQVPVLTAVDSGKHIFDKVLGSRKDIESALAGRIEAGSILCSDGWSAYTKVAAAAGAIHRRIALPQASYLTKAGVGRSAPQEGRVGLGRVNAHHSRLKTFINHRCRGVATKYLSNYLGWNRAMRKDGFEGSTLLGMALA